MLFKLGTFITRIYGDAGNFGIFEGEVIPQRFSSTGENYSLIFFYNPQEWDSKTGTRKPMYSFTTDDALCHETVTSYSSGTCSWRELTQAEIEQAIQIMHECGLHWDNENANLVNFNTGEILYHIIQPNTQYNGQVVSPIDSTRQAILNEAFKEMLPKPTTTTTYTTHTPHASHYPSQSMYDQEYGWNGEYWD